MRNKAKNAVFLILGVLTALVITLSQVFYSQNSTLNKKKADTEQQSDESSSTGGEAFLFMASGPSLSTLQTHIHHEVAVLFEIIFLDEEPTFLELDVPLALGKYFRTLFQIIIAPNAP